MSAALQQVGYVVGKAGKRKSVSARPRVLVPE